MLSWNEGKNKNRKSCVNQNRTSLWTIHRHSNRVGPLPRMGFGSKMSPARNFLKRLCKSVHSDPFPSQTNLQQEAHQLARLGKTPHISLKMWLIWSGLLLNNLKNKHFNFVPRIVQHWAMWILCNTLLGIFMLSCAALGLSLSNSERKRQPSRWYAYSMLTARQFVASGIFDQV